MSDHVLLEHERLDVYRVALDLDSRIRSALPRRGERILRDQIERASLGIVLNIAEGAGRRSAPDKRRFYEMARGSATEVAAALDVVRARDSLTPEHHANLRALIIRIVQMLTKLSGFPRD